MTAIFAAIRPLLSNQVLRYAYSGTSDCPIHWPAWTTTLHQRYGDANGHFVRLITASTHILSSVSTSHRVANRALLLHIQYEKISIFPHRLPLTFFMILSRSLWLKLSISLSASCRCEDSVRQGALITALNESIISSWFSRSLRLVVPITINFLPYNTTHRQYNSLSVQYSK